MVDAGAWEGNPTFWVGKGRRGHRLRFHRGWLAFCCNGLALYRNQDLEEEGKKEAGGHVIH